MLKNHPDYLGRVCTYPEEIERTGHYGSTLFEHQVFFDNLAGSRSNAATALEGFQALLLAAGAQQSMKTGEKVRLKAYCDEQSLEWPWAGR